MCQVADALRRATVGDVVTFVRNRNINYTNVCTYRCRFCGFSKGPAVAQPPGQALPAHAGGHRRAGGRSRPAVAPPRSACRAGSIPTSTASTTCICPGGEGSGADHACARLHGAGGLRRSPPPGRAARVVPPAAPRRRPRQPARHRRRDPRRRDPGRHLPRQDHHRRVAGGAPHRPPGRAALQHHDHVRHHRTASPLGPPPAADPGAADGRPAASPNSCRCRSCTWPPPSTWSAAPGGARPSARRSCSTPWPGSATTA